MTVRTLRCECGFTAAATDQDALVAAVQRHAIAAHGMKLDRELVLRLAEDAGIDQKR